MLLLLVHDDQHAAISLYRKAGFVEQGSVEHAGQMAIWMARMDGGVGVGGGGGD